MTGRCEIPWCDVGDREHSPHERTVVTVLAADGTPCQLVEHGRGDTPTDVTLVLVDRRLGDRRARLGDVAALRLGLGMLGSVRRHR